ncbi:MAG: DUF1801 domain-containing protein [Acidobacteria bacterium]|nr:DUF1801 domain-containing protein [Acidobacteriota bacterium]
MKAFENEDVAEKFEAYPPAIRSRLLVLRSLILETAENTDGVGPIEETLKWGEPAYVTSQSKSGTTVRIGWKKAQPSRYAMYLHCRTSLIETFRALFPDELRFEGNRAIVFDESNELPEDPLRFCIAAALTYHRNKRASR